MVRLINPQEEMMPRYRYSTRYGHKLMPSATITHQLPGVWRIIYHTNEHGFRTGMPSVSNVYDRPNIVVIGDSNTFGLGVADGEEFSALLNNALGTEASVVNLGVPGWGLTSEIRAYYEFGRLFDPRIVILQFSDNDPDDNMYQRVTTVENGRFRFHLDNSMNSWAARAKDWLGDSVFQKSQLYNFIRYNGYAYWRGRMIARESENDMEKKEIFYNDLLIAFALDLSKRHIPLVMLSPPNQLAMWPRILKQVESLDRQGLLRYVRTEPWFANLSNFYAPDGHPWGTIGHRVVAEHLADVLRDGLSGGRVGEAPEWITIR
jgi:hypothetical protein